eukprot:GEMP01047628.1.p1 GENE.GEMP01047628.1~~GEMP01047628.1.p1  ORF type:complete len:226 (+),score=68.41 GEMP01047628.1:926-1603(+)
MKVEVEQIVEQIIEVPVIEVVEEVIEVPRLIKVQKYVEVPQIVKVPKFVDVPEIEIVEQIIEILKVEVVDKIIEVPEVQIVKKYVEVPRVEYIDRVVDVPKITVVEKVIEIPIVEHRDVFDEVVYEPINLGAVTRTEPEVVQVYEDGEPMKAVKSSVYHSWDMTSQRPSITLPAPPPAITNCGASRPTRPSLLSWNSKPLFSPPLTPMSRLSGFSRHAMQTPVSA